MVIIGSPRDIENYYLADEDTAFTLHQKGFHPSYRDGDAVYFWINKKLKKALKELGLEIE